MAFDPDKYLAKKSEFNPDAYLAKAKPRFSGQGFVEGALKALPAAGALAGGVAGTALGPAGTFGGGALGAAGGSALKNLIEAQLLGQEKSRGEIYGDPIKEAALESVGQGIGGLVSKGAGLAGKYIKEPIENILAKLASGEKAGAPAIKEAAQRIGVTPTRGMLTSEPFIQKFESGLAQTPSLRGQELNKSIQDVQTGMRSAGEKALSSGINQQTEVQLGAAAKSLVSKDIGKKLEPAIEVYKKIENDIYDIDIPEISTKRISQNISSLPYAKISGSQESTFAKQISENLEKVKSLDELRNLRSYVGKAFNNQNISPSMNQTVSEIYGRLSKLEQNSITRAAISASANPQYGRSVALEMVKEIKDANKVYAGVSSDLKEIATHAGMGRVNNYGDFIRKMEAMPDERFADSFFKLNNVKALGDFQKQFPESFELMRKSKLSDIYMKSLTKGELSIPKLITNTKSIGPESRKLLLGDASDQGLKDIETVYNATYQKVGPSGTPEGNLFTTFNPVSPSAWYHHYVSDAKKYILDNPQKFSSFKNLEVQRLEKTLPKDSLTKMADEIKSRALYSTSPRAVIQTIENDNAIKRKLNQQSGER